MNKTMLALGLTAMIVPTLSTIPAADAQRRHSHKTYKHREYRGDRDYVRCKKNNGTTGTIVGGVGGALLGRTIDTRGDRTIGTLGGAAAGALAGRAIDKGSTKNRCR